MAGSNNLFLVHEITMDALTEHQSYGRVKPEIGQWKVREFYKG